MPANVSSMRSAPEGNLSAAGSLTTIAELSLEPVGPVSDGVHAAVKAMIGHAALTSLDVMRTLPDSFFCRKS